MSRVVCWDGKELTASQLLHHFYLWWPIVLQWAEWLNDVAKYPAIISHNKNDQPTIVTTLDNETNNKGMKAPQL